MRLFWTSRAWDDALPGDCRCASTMVRYYVVVVVGTHQGASADVPAVLSSPHVTAHGRAQGNGSLYFSGKCVGVLRGGETQEPLRASAVSWFIRLFLRTPQDGGPWFRRNLSSCGI